MEFIDQGMLNAEINWFQKIIFQFTFILFVSNDIVHWFSFNYINPASFRSFLKHLHFLTQMSSVYCICQAQLW